MKQIIQHIIFPDDDALFNYRELFYRHGGIVMEGGKKGILCLNKYGTVEFCTYFNGVSYGKWRLYTTINQILLNLMAEGDFEITLCGYSLVNGIPARKVLGKRHIVSDGKDIVCVEYPENQEQILGFEISAFSELEILGGYYEGVFEAENVKDVELALSTTTCWKEEFIIKNIQRLKEGILDLDEEISRHFNIHIVDNGRTLKREDFPDDNRIYYHPNKNVGGAGGYARGMIECRHQIPNATHVLLMDDDVMILPESIYRTYVLLKNVKEKYSNSFVGGAMLIMEEKNIQHEDSGMVDDIGSFIPLKPRFNHLELSDNLRNEKTYYGSNKYQAWWYCCIPMKIIEKNGLPLPLFIRGDDVEYSLRCKADIMTMNGIGIWHMGFYGKYSASMNIYQECRNLLIAQAASGILPKVNLARRIKKLYRDNILRHNYGAAELSLKAFEDYMRGPAFIMQDRGEEIIKENGKLNLKLQPLEQLESMGANIYEDPYWDSRRGFLKKWLYRITYNGHRFWPERLLGRKPVAIPFDFEYRPSKMAMKRICVAVNPVQQTGCVCEIDRKRFRELQRRYYRDFLCYSLRRKDIVDRYRKAGKTITSEEFWRKYLGI